MEVNNSTSDAFADNPSPDWKAVDQKIFGNLAGSFLHFDESVRSNPHKFQTTAFGFLTTITVEYKSEGCHFRTLTLSQFGEVVSKHPEVLDLLLGANVDRSSEKIRELVDFVYLAYLKEPAPIVACQEGGTNMVDKPESMMTTVIAWEGSFIGNSHNDLLKHIRCWIFRSERYARCMGIIQSSGTGKSRCVDELSKQQFVVPMNLRHPKGQGFPPSDKRLFDFFSPVPEDRERTQTKAQAFFIALFEQVVTEVNRLRVDNQDGEIATLFRSFMANGQTFHAHGPCRQRFYDRVVTRAENLVASESDVSEKEGSPRHASGPKGSVTVFESASSAIEAVDSEIKSENSAEFISEYSESPTSGKRKRRNSEIPAGERIRTKGSRGPGPTIILAFDEANTMKVGPTSGEKWTMWTELCRALRICIDLKIVALFMTTTGKISTFSAPAQNDASQRTLDRKLHLIPPFCNLGFDQHAPKIMPGSVMNLENVVLDAHIGRLGRPLFATRYDAAAQTDDHSSRKFMGEFAELKLLGRLVDHSEQLKDSERFACLSQRLPIEFQMTRYNTSDAERRQVENHMRVCIKFSDDLQSMTTINPSEPILSEAAFRIMDSRNFNAPSALLDVLQGFSVHQGDRGELVTLLLLTLARDQAVHDAIARGKEPELSRMVPVTDFLSHLFRSSAEHDILSATPSMIKEGSQDAKFKLCDQFKDSYLHFNHFVKVHEHDMFDREYLWRLMSRGAAVLCAPNQKGIDAMSQFTYRDTALRKENIGVILYQFKNDKSYTSTIRPELFDPPMNPFHLGIFDSLGTTVPIIRIVLALAGQTPSLMSVPCTSGKTGQFTSYDIWCSGISPEFYAPITNRNETIWGALLKASRGWEKLYFEADEESQQSKMSMNPGAATDPCFFQQWAPLL